jgi:hypothetical protein
MRHRQGFGEAQLNSNNVSSVHLWPKFRIASSAASCKTAASDGSILTILYLI